MRYEALKEDFEREIVRIVNYVALPPHCTVGELREKYVEHALTLLNGDNRALHRKRIVGDWRNYVTEGIRDLLKSEIGETLRTLGYETGMDW